MKGLFIPEITAEMFRNGCLESIEALMAEGEIYDIDYQQPCEDCISRKDVHDMLENLPVTVENKWFNWLQKACIRLAELPSVTPKEKTGYCKDCKWWKDNDGVYRRGIGAESKCPINRKEVYEGNGYCFMFEPQESEET